MEKFRRRILSLFIVLAMMLPMGMGNGLNAYAKASKTVKLEKTSVTLAIDGTSTIKVKNAAKSAKITYKSEKPSIAKVSNKGKVTALKPGNTKVKVTVKQSGKAKTLDYSVKVSKPTLKKSVTVNSGSRLTLKVDYLPKKAKVEWKSENTKVATVKNGVVTGKSRGKVRITAKVSYKNKKYSTSTTIEVKESGGSKPVDIKKAKVGDIVTFGRYEQDNNTANGKEAIQWQVLAKKNGKILVISKYGLDRRKYNETKTDVTWETCTLRKWLDADFKNVAFNSAERSRIPRVTVRADLNPHLVPEWSDIPAPAGNNTEDQVFLLSVVEAEKYFTSFEARRCAPTAYAKAQGVREGTYYKNTCTTADGEATCWWWLRSPGPMGNDEAAIGGFDGNTGDSWYVNGSTIAVRPAMWINI